MAVDEPHEPVALGGLQEVGRRDLLARVVAQPQQHFHGRPRIAVAVGGDDRLAIELEAALLERALQQLQPLDLAALACVAFVARRVDRHVAALALGLVAG